MQLLLWALVDISRLEVALPLLSHICRRFYHVGTLIAAFAGSFAGPTGPLPRVCVCKPACPKVIIKKSAVELLSQISVSLSRDAEGGGGGINVWV